MKYGRDKMKKWIPARARTAYLETALFAAFLAALFFPCFHGLQTGDSSFYKVYMDGEYVGSTRDKDTADSCMIQARKNLASGSSELIYAEGTLTYQKDTALVGLATEKEKMEDAMTLILKAHEKGTMQEAYTVKIGDYMVCLRSADEVEQLLQTALDKYDTSKSYGVELLQDSSCKLNIMTASVYNKNEKQEAGAAKQEKDKKQTTLPEAGIFAAFTDMMNTAKQQAENANKSFSDFQLGLISMGFDEKVQIVQSYVPSSNLTDLSKAVDDVTKDKETNQTYEVKTGDTLGGIAQEHNMKVKDLITMNTVLEDENSTIRVGDELTISVPQPELSIDRQEEKYYEENYEEAVQYVDNKDWLTSQTQVVQQPSSGHRKVIAVVTYKNNSVVTTDIIKQEVTSKAVPKIVERGTKIPPTYIRPVSGGRISSGFGGRKAPKRGASTFHEGVDFSVPVGTAVMASCGGTVIRAGWASGYGRVIYLQHPDGRQTRYGHLSKLLVTSGQSIKQGQKIALSGNTGNSTGPHLHFEIRINGNAVNPLKYLN